MNMIQYTRLLLSACTFALLSATNLPAADGQLDPSFGGGSGVAYSDFSYLSSNVLDQRMSALKTDALGQVVGLGYFRRNASGQDFDCSIVRRNAAGTAYDTTFRPPSGYGPLAIDLGGDLSDFCGSLAFLGDGRIAIGGQSSTGASSKTGIVLMLNPDGSRASSFFSNGLFRVNTDFGLLAQQSIGSSSVYALKTDQQGRLLVLGSFNPSDTVFRGFIARFTASGGLDQSFGIDGLVIIPDPGAEFSVADDLVLQGDKILLANAHAAANAPLVGEIIKLQTNGSLDLSFGAGTGRVAVPICAYFEGMALTPQNQIVLGCRPSGDNRGIVKLNSGGDIDISFGNAGFAELRAATPQQEISSINDVVVQADGSIITVGDLRNLTVFSQGLNGVWDIVVGRFTSAGTRDLSFGYLNGQSDFRFSNPLGTATEAVNELASSIFLDNQGRLLIAASRSLPNVSGGIGNQQVIARLQGTLPDKVFQNGFE